jgi:NAD(P)H-nitrite reductase large subunit
MDDQTPKSKEEMLKEKTKQLLRVVCICKGIPLGKVLDALPGCETVQDVNRKCGTGSGGCRGERCGPRIKMLLKKFKEHQAD